MLLRSSKRVMANLDISPVAPRKKARKSKPLKAVAEPLKVTDLNDDCLEHIFRYLNITDLTNVANANSKFANAARLVFKLKHSNEILCISDSGKRLTLTDIENRNVTTVFATATVFLQNFGHLVKSLQLDYTWPEHHWREIESLVFRYCRKTLNKLELKNCTKNVMEEIQDEFENVKVVTIADGFLDQNTIQFSKWFPKIACLKLQMIHFRGTEAINGKFRWLKNLDMTDIRTADSTTETKVRDFLRSNCHIKYLNINFGGGNWLHCVQDFLMFLSKTLQHLEILGLHKLDINPVKSKKHIHFKNVKDFLLSTLERQRFPQNLSITFGNLKKLKLYRIDDNDKKWTEFICQHTKLTSLTYHISSLRNLTMNDILEFQMKLPMLGTLKISTGSMSPDTMVQFLKAWKSTNQLKTIVLFDWHRADLIEYKNAFGQDLQRLCTMKKINYKNNINLVFTRKSN